MLKLKIGDNFLITTEKDREMSTFIIFTMGCFSLHNKTLVGIDNKYIQANGIGNFVKSVKDSHLSELYILVKTKSNDLLPEIIKAFLLESPETKIHIVKMDRLLDTREYKLAEMVYGSLKQDENSIIHHLDKLDEYKKFANRYKAIPSELKVVNENIQKMGKENKTCEKNITLEDLRYLDLIDKVQLEGDCLILDIKPLRIYASEPLGKVITYDTYASNKYIRKATEYIYKGCHFGMVKTRIAIHPDFRPEFIDTLDHQWDDMFKVNNWSTVGYLHFGKNHLCGGEFNDVIAHTGEHGLDYYFLCLKQYITTANIRDYAGLKVWWYPIYDDNEELVYCAALDILRDALIESGKVTGKMAQEIKNMSLKEFQEWRLSKNIYFTNINLRYTSSDVRTHSRNEDSFLKWCEENDKELYNELKEGVNL